MKNKTYCLLFFVVFFTACSKDQLELDNAIIQQYLLDNNIAAEEHSSGIYYLVTKEGTGEKYPDLQSDVTIQFKGYLTNSEVFDEAKEGNELKVFIGDLVEGLQEGLLLLSEGAEATFFIPSALGYGEATITGVPCNSVLIFEVKLVSVLRETIDNQTIKSYLEENNIEAIELPSGLHYAIIKEGIGEEYPNLASNIKITYKAYLTNGVLIDETLVGSPTIFPLSQLILGFQEGIPYFKKESKGILFIPSSLGYGCEDRLNIPSNSVLIFEFELIDFN